MKYLKLHTPCPVYGVPATEKKYDEVNNLLKKYLTFLNTSINQPLTVIEAAIQFQNITTTLGVINEFTMTDANFILPNETRDFLTKELLVTTESARAKIIQGEYYLGKHTIKTMYKNNQSISLPSIPTSLDTLLQTLYLQKNTTLIQYYDFLSALYTKDEPTLATMDREFQERAQRYGQNLFYMLLEKNGLGNYIIEEIRPKLYEVFGSVPLQLIGKIKLLDTTLALQEYQRKNNRLPDTLGELAPDYLLSVPNNPPIEYDKTFQVVYYENDNGAPLAPNSRTYERTFITAQGKTLVESLHRNIISQIKSKADKEIILGLLKVKLALQKYYKDQKSYPPSLEVLMPKYIQEIPTFREEKLSYDREQGIIFYYQPLHSEESFSKYFLQTKSPDLFLDYIEELRYREIFDPIKEKQYLEMQEKEKQEDQKEVTEFLENNPEIRVQLRGE